MSIPTDTVSNISSDPEVQQILASCYVSTEAFCKTFQPETYNLPFSPKIHKPIFERLDDRSKRLVVIVAPRGIGKTTLAHSYAAKEVLYREHKFIVLVSATGESAIEQSENLKEELISNRMIQQFFGGIKPDSHEDVFSKKNWTTSTGTRVTPRGAGQQVRGMHWVTEGRPERPSLIIIDDLEDDEAVLSDTQRAKLKKWFFSALRHVIDRSKENWRIVIIGTILHEQSLLNELMQSEEWDSIRLELCDDDFNSNWPEQYSSEACKKSYEEHRSMGVAHEWMREFRGLSIDPEEADFKADYFQYYDEAEVGLDDKAGIGKLIVVDPARSVTDRACETGIVGVAIDYNKNLIYVRDVVHGRFYPDEIYKHIFEMGKRLKTKNVYVEVTGLSEFIKQPMDNENVRSGAMMNIQYVPAKGDKDARIRTLSPYYRMGLVRHNQSGVCSPLENQLLSFDRGLKDIIDAFSYVVEAMGVGGRRMKNVSQGDKEDAFSALVKRQKESMKKGKGMVRPIPSKIPSTLKGYV